VTFADARPGGRVSFRIRRVTTQTITKKTVAFSPTAREESIVYFSSRETRSDGELCEFFADAFVVGVLRENALEILPCL
jgi:hypothetical protein